MQLEKWFCEPVWNFNLDLDLDALSKYAYDLAETQPSNQRSNRGGWQSPIIDQFDDILEPIKDQINISLKNAKKSMGLKDEYNFEMQTGWFNINGPGSWNVKHLHPNSVFSGTVYLKVPQGEPGNIQFYRHSIVLSYLDDDLIKDYNEMTSGTVTYKAQENCCLIFPSWIEHQVTPNFTDQDRISFSFNTGKVVYHDKQ